MNLSAICKVMLFQSELNSSKKRNCYVFISSILENTFTFKLVQQLNLKINLI